MSEAMAGGEPVVVLNTGPDGWLLVLYPDGDQVWTPPEAVTYPEDEEPDSIGNSVLMEPGSGIYLDNDGKVDEGASS